MMSCFQVLVLNIAAADLGYTLFLILPTVISTCANKWVLGLLMCKVSGFLQFVFGCVNILSICALNISKLSSLKHPIRSRIRSSKTAYMITGVIWMIALVQPMLAARNGFVYYPAAFRCLTERNNESFTMMIVESVILNIAFIFLPMLVIVVTGFYLLYLVRVKAASQIRFQGVAVILIVSLAFVLSWLPLMLYNLKHNFHSHTHTAFLHTGLFCVFISTACNPYLYIFTSKSFKEFVRKALRGKIRRKTSRCIPVSKMPIVLVNDRILMSSDL